MSIDFKKGISLSGEAPEGGGGATINNQDKVIYANGVYSADSGYTGLGNVEINVYSTSGLLTMFNQMETEATVAAQAASNADEE